MSKVPTRMYRTKTVFVTTTFYINDNKHMSGNTQQEGILLKQTNKPNNVEEMMQFVIYYLDLYLELLQCRSLYYYNCHL